MEDAAYARIEFALTEAGLRDALRRGIQTSREVVHYVEPNEFAWDDLFKLNPEIIESDDGYVRGVRLPIGRRHKLSIDHLKPDLYEVEFPFQAEDSLREFAFWYQPEVVEALQPPQAFNHYLTLEDALKHEEGVLADSAKERVRLEQQLEESLLEEWRAWVRDEGISSTRELIAASESFLADVEQVVARSDLTKKLNEFRRSLGHLISALNSFDRLASSDTDLDLLMANFAVCAEELQSVSYAAADEQARKAQLDGAVTWVADHGSSRLRKALSLGLLGTSMGAYRDERLALERPGWTWWDREKMPARNLVNPKEGDLDALIAARKADSAATLSYIQEVGTVVTSTFMSRAIYATVADINGEPF